MGIGHFIDMARGYSRMCMFDQQEACVRDAKNEFREAYSAFRADCNQEDLLAFVSQIQGVAPHAGSKIYDWASKDRFVATARKASREEVIGKALAFETARARLLSDNGYQSFQFAGRTLSFVIAQMGPSNGSLGRLKILLEDSGLSPMVPRIEKLHKYVMRDFWNHGQS